MLSPGLYVVSTPIGNLEDITLRALAVLKEASVIACEDTRHTLILLNHYGIKNRLVSFHEYNKLERTPELIARLTQGETVAVVSDAGTPGISDPGFYLIRETVRQGLPVIPIPGASAILAGLVASGLPSDHFVFEGFIVKRDGRRNKKLKELKSETRTMVFYDSPFRIRRTLAAMLEILGDRRIAVARELTKKFEEVIRGTISEVIEKLGDERIKGEIVLVVEGGCDKGGGQGDGCREDDEGAA